MKYEEALKLLKECGQEHVLAHWEKLGRADRAALLAQIERFDAESLERCREALAKGSTPPDASKGLSAKVDTLKGEALAKAEAAAGRSCARGAWRCCSWRAARAPGSDSTGPRARIQSAP